ncbi:glucosaminidase domain-containing protein [Paenibacillus thailandensis]|uniref:Glucosaminidase domain-containing protein n=1 Tax=Paenibacillus thailandensis TaxID=393250 RepID=A0ABW5QTY1_9BACL
MRKGNKQLWIYLLSMVLLVIVEVRFQTTIKAAMVKAHEPNIAILNGIHNWHAIGLEKPVLLEWSGKRPAAAALSEPASQPSAERSAGEQATAAKQLSGAAASVTKASGQEPAKLYQVTAYHLNVRSGPDAETKIVKVVDRGMELAVKQQLPSGWLELQDGGYVNGKYAKAVSAIELAAVKQTTPPLHLQTLAGDAQPGQEAAKLTLQQDDTERQPAKPAKPTSKVETASDLTEADISELFEGTELEGHGIEEVVLEVEEEYGINALFTIAVMKLESGNGKSKLAKNKNNLFGLNATGGGNHKAFSFETKGDSVRKFGQLLSKHYVGKGLTTIEKIAKKYCPANPKWASLVMNIMKRDYKKL